jgi:hypothetical protein
MTTDLVVGSKLKKMNFLSVPTCELGGLPGSLIALRLRMLDRDRVRTNAPNRDKFRLVARSVAPRTAARSKNPAFAWRKPIVKPLVATLVSQRVPHGHHTRRHAQFFQMLG